MSIRLGFGARAGDEMHVDVAILTALALEEAAVVRAIGNCSAYRSHGQVYYLGDVAGEQVLVSRIGVGSASAAAATDRVIGEWHPAWLILVGIAGGTPGPAADLRLGDLLLPDQLVGYELARITPAGPARRYEVYRPDAELLAQARTLPAAGWADMISAPRPDDPHGRIRPLVHVGPVLTGDKVLADQAALAELRQDWPQAIGVEMEGHGVALAAYHNRRPFLVVKAVSDFADHAKDDGWQRYCAEAAARFAVALVPGLLGPALPVAPPVTDGSPREPAVVYRPGAKRTAGSQDRVVAQPGGDSARRILANPVPEAAQPGPPPAGFSRRLTLEATAGTAHFSVVVHIESVELLSDVDVLVVPQNTYFETSQHFKASVSAAVARASARRGDGGEILAEPVRDELRDWMLRRGRPGLPVAPGTVIATSPGAMAQSHIRQLYHVAVAAPWPGSNDYHVEPAVVAQAARNVLALARAERSGFDPPLRSVCFPLLGAGRGGMNPLVSFAWLWTSLEDQLRQGGWDIHFISQSRAVADLIVAALVRADVIADAPGPPG